MWSVFGLWKRVIQIKWLLVILCVPVCLTLTPCGETCFWLPLCFPPTPVRFPAQPMRSCTSKKKSICSLWWQTPNDCCGSHNSLPPVWTAHLNHTVEQQLRERWDSTYCMQCSRKHCPLLGWTDPPEHSWFCLSTELMSIICVVRCSAYILGKETVLYVLCSIVDTICRRPILGVQFALPVCISVLMYLKMWPML